MVQLCFASIELLYGIVDRVARDFGVVQQDSWVSITDVYVHHIVRGSVLRSPLESFGRNRPASS